MTKWGDRQGRRQDILTAGQKLLREKGLESLQMREVARRAGIAPGTVYTYFPTKEALFAVMYAERLDQLANELEPVMASTSNLEDLFVAVATGYRDVYAEFGKNLDILAVIGQRVDLDATARDQLIESAVRLLGRFRNVAEATGAEDPELTVTILWAMVIGLANHFTSVRHDLLTRTWDDTVRFAARSLLHGLAVTETSPPHGGQ